MLVCFDRLENLDTNEKLQAFAKMIEFLTDTSSVQAVLPIAFFRGRAWEENFSNRLDEHIAKRLSINRFELKGCDDEQAVQLVRARLAFAYGVAAVTDVSPLDEQVLREKISIGLMSPGDVIALTNAHLSDLLQKETEVVDPLDELQQEFESQYQAVLADFALYQPDRGRLRCALELYLRHGENQSKYTIGTTHRRRDKYVDLECQIKPLRSSAVPVAFIVDTQVHHAAVNASLTRGIKMLENSQPARAIYVRDKRCPIPVPPRWQATNTTLDKFKNKGGIVLDLDKQDAARWYALALLHYAVTEGDVTVRGEAGKIRSASAEEFARFVCNRLHGERYPCFQELDRLLSGNKKLDSKGDEIDVEPPPEELARKIVTLLQPVPMMMMHSAMLAERLSDGGRTVTVENVLAVVNQFTNRFATIRSRDGVLVMVRKESLHA